MLLFVGLGNPGPQYADHRHNIGFMAVDAIASRLHFPAFRQKFSGLISEGSLGGEKVLLLKPQTFMNNSGKSVGDAMRFYKLKPENVTVFYDELDLVPGRIRTKRGGGAAGHNGIRSIDDHIGKDYRRIRLGIGHPGDRERVRSHVLGDFAKADAVWLEPLLEALAESATHLTETDDNKFSTAVALRLQPPKPQTKPAKSDKQG